MRKLLLIFLFVSGLMIQASAQDRTVSGKVSSSEDDSTLPGVTVVLKGTTTGTTTDIDGNYKLSVPSDGGMLVYSFVGLATQEVEIGSRSVIDLVMEPDAQQMAEIVVTSYGIARAKDELTYVTQQIDAEDLMAAQQVQAGIGMVGKVAGMQINVQNNGVNPDTQVLLRGMNSISKSNSALIVIDGAIASSGAFGDLNPNDIESVNVLKGANAAALYGSDAVNGALIVTTKKGNLNDKLTIGLNSTVTFEEVAYMPDFQTENGIGWAGHYDRIENTNWGPRFDGVVRPVGPSFPEGYPVSDQMLAYSPIQDNVKSFFNTGVTSTNTLSVSGGDESSTFYMSYGRQNTTGIVPDDEYERNTFRINASKKIGKMSLSLNSSYFQDKTDVVGDQIGDQDRPLYWFLLNTPANIPLTSYKDYNNIASYGHSDNYYNAYYQNPYWAVGTNRDTDRTTRLNATMAASYDILSNLNFTARVAVNSIGGDGKNIRDRQEYNADLQGSHSTVSSFVEDYEFEEIRYNGNFVLSGNFDITEKLKVTPIVGFTFKNEQQRESTIRSNNLAIPGFYDVNSGTVGLTDVDGWQKRTYGMFADVTVGFDDFVFLSLTGRQDATSTLDLDDNSYFYPSVGLSFVLTEGIEALKNNNILSYAKINFSNATVYNDLPIYAINERLFQQNTRDLTGGYDKYPSFPLGTNNAYYLGRTTVDPNIQKEKLNTSEVGATLGFFGGRVNVDAAYYVTTTTDLITNVSSAYASGATSLLTNIGELKGTGLELSIDGTVLDMSGFKWNMAVNYTANETVVEEIAEGLDEVSIESYGTYGTFAIKGSAFPQLKAASFVRNDDGLVVVDAGGSPVVGDVTAMGKTTPDYIVGVTSKMSFKGLSLNATMDYRTGHVYYEQGSDAMEFTGRSVASVSAGRQNFVWPNSVTENADGTFSPNTLPISGGEMSFWQNRYNEIKENYVKDATALKLREVSLSYSFPRAILDKTKVINKLSIGFVGRNLMTWLPEENRFADPEFKNTRTTDAANGIGIGGYFTSPPTRTYGFNLNIEF